MSAISLDEPLWQNWFTNLDDLQEIRDRVSLHVKPIESLGDIDVETACQQMQTAWSNVFIPGPEHCLILQRHVKRAMAFAKDRYPSFRQYLSNCDQGVPQELRPSIWCFTGLAGVSKSSLIGALERLFNSQHTHEEQVCGHQLHLQPIKSIRIDSNLSISGVLRRLAGPVSLLDRKAMSQANLEGHVRQMLHARCTVTLVVDEMQFLTQSKSASTQTSKLIWIAGCLGVPLTYVANYSLGHKLFERPQEEIDRLLNTPIVLDPPMADSPHWHSVVDEYIKVSPASFGISAKEHADELHRLSAGMFRSLQYLLIHAYRIANLRGFAKSITIDDVRSAYQGSEYSGQRKTIEAIASLKVSNFLLGKRRDLTSPFAKVNQPSQPIVREKGMSTQDLAASLLESAISVGSRKVYQELKEAVQATDAGQKTKATITPMPKRPKISADALYAGAQIMREQSNASMKKGAPEKTKS